MLERALDEVDPAADPLLASRIYGLRGQLLRCPRRPLGRLAAVDRAVALAEGASTPELAGALAVMATRRGYDFRLAEALAVGRRAVQVAQDAHAVLEESRARLALSWALIQAGEVDEGLREGRRGVRGGRRHRPRVRRHRGGGDARVPPVRRRPAARQPPGDR
jgi:hypothetical protein